MFHGFDGFKLVNAKIVNPVIGLVTELQKTFYHTSAPVTGHFVFDKYQKPNHNGFHVLPFAVYEADLLSPDQDMYPNTNHDFMRSPIKVSFYIEI